MDTSVTSSENTIEANIQDEAVSDINEPADVVEPVCQIIGNVEACINGVLTGWLHDPVNTDNRLDVIVFERNKVVGEGTANIYRGDLKANGIGDGNYGFEVVLDRDLYDGRKHQLTLRDKHYQMSLNYDALVEREQSSSSITEIDAGVVSGEITLASYTQRESVEFELLIDGQPVNAGCFTQDLLEPTALVSIVVPEAYYDDNYHLFCLRPKHYSCRVEEFTARLSGITTAWEHLSRSINTDRLSALSSISGHRYKALQEQMRVLAKSNVSPEVISNLITAHDVVVEGYEHRTAFPRLSLPTSATPVISIVIPVHNLFEVTYHCLASLILAGGDIPFEVIIVDDLSSDLTTEICSYVDNIRVVRNEKNLRFLLSATAGADAARGDYILFLNNDTEVTTGWLEELLAVFKNFHNVGLAGSKLIYPDGRLQEAGGIIWGSGKAWNVGHAQNASHPQYNYVRQVDYVSGAAMMIKTELWNSIGGFSKELIPAYYEDADLAFKVREAGYKTYYCPASTVVHYEGMSNGRELTSGVKQFQNINAPKFRKKWRHAYRHNGQEGVSLVTQKDRDIDFRVLLVDHSTPRPDMDAGSYAVCQEIKLMQEMGCKITFAPSNMAHMGKYTRALQNRGVECIHTPFYRSVGDLLKDRGKEFDLIYIIRYDVAEAILPSVKEFSSAKVVLNNCDLHFLRELRAELNAGNKKLDGPKKTRKRELKTMRSVDAVFSYSELEHSVIASHNLNTENIFKCPWVLYPKRSQTPFEGRHGIAFLGGFRHLPNIESVKYFCKNVMPLVNATHPDLKFHIYGSAVTDEIEQLASDTVVVEGFVENLETVFDQCRVFVAPLLSGAGIKGKVLESIAHGVPSVLSPIAAESTGLCHGTNTLIANSDEEWAEHVINLYNDQTLWEQLSESSQDLLVNEYSFASGIHRMTSLFEYLELDPADNRGQIFN